MSFLWILYALAWFVALGIGMAVCILCMWLCGPKPAEQPTTVCPQCKQDDCLGPDVAANRGGCRMHTWADVG